MNFSDTLCTTHLISRCSQVERYSTHSYSIHLGPGPFVFLKVCQTCVSPSVTLTHNHSFYFLPLWYLLVFFFSYCVQKVLQTRLERVNNYFCWTRTSQLLHSLMEQESGSSGPVPVRVWVSISLISQFFYGHLAWMSLYHTSSLPCHTHTLLLELGGFMPCLWVCEHHWGAYHGSNEKLQSSISSIFWGQKNIFKISWWLQGYEGKQEHSFPDHSYLKFS